MSDTTLTWLGHSAFRLTAPGGAQIYVDPWLENPNCPPEERSPTRVDLIALTHGHPDHFGQTLDLVDRFGCPVTAVHEIVSYIAERRGVDEDMAEAGNKGGTVELAGVQVTFTDARHSSSLDGVYLGEPAGLVIEVSTGRKVYFAGDTCVFGDMALIGRLYEPDLVVLPIGDHFTMGPREAAVAVDLLGAKRCVPCHYGTLPILHGTPSQLQELAPDVQVIALKPGEHAAV